MQKKEKTFISPILTAVEMNVIILLNYSFRNGNIKLRKTTRVTNKK